MKLTNTACLNAKPKDKPYKLADGGGLYLLVNPNGAKYWRLKYRYLGKEKVLALGIYPLVSLADAREGRTNAKKQLMTHVNPSAAKKGEKRKAILKGQQTFEAIAREWHSKKLDNWKPHVKRYLAVPSSFGAIEEKGVPDAIIAAVEAIKKGATHYVKSDIASFFTRISRSKVIEAISEGFDDEERFFALLEQATNLEVENLADLEKRHGADFKQLFIFDSVGTPQGCCLSPLFGNILLYDFDIAMNSGDMVCLRYLDDFIIFGPSLKAVKAAFRRALKILEPLGLSAYDPEKDKDKASYGAVDQGFEFLGVEFQGKNIRPAPKARRKLLDGIDEIILASIQEDFSKVKDGSKEDCSLVKTLHHIHNKVKGWGNQYYFCNDKAVWGSLDAEIDIRIRKYFGHHFAVMRKLDQSQKRRQLGVHMLVDSKSKPIEI